jgi:hypothetical protein
MVRASFSKYSGFSLAFSQGLRRRLLAAGSWVYDFHLGGSVHWRRILGEIYYEWLQVCGVKNHKGFGFYL